MHRMNTARRTLRFIAAATFAVLMDGVSLGTIRHDERLLRWVAIAPDGTVLRTVSYDHPDADVDPEARWTSDDARRTAGSEVCVAAGWGPHAPADEGDFRFIITPWDCPEMDATHTVIVVDDRGGELERFDTNCPYEAVEAAREAQTIPFEERMDLYAARGW